MKIHAVAALISLLSLPGALSANLRDGRTTKRKLGKANEKKIKVPQSPPLIGVAPGAIPKVLIGVDESPKLNDSKFPFLIELYKKLEDVCEIEVVISHRPYFDFDKVTEQGATSSLYRGEYHALDSLLFRNRFVEGGYAQFAIEKQYELSAPITKVCISLFNRCMPQAYCCQVEFGF